MDIPWFSYCGGWSFLIIVWHISFCYFHNYSGGLFLLFYLLHLVKEKSFYYKRGELCNRFFPLLTWELGKEVVTYMLLCVYMPEWDLLANLYRVYWGWGFFKWAIFIAFSPILHSTTHYRDQPIHLGWDGDILLVWGGCPHGVMVKAMDCGIIVSKFELQSRYYIHFHTNTLGKGMRSLILPTMG